MPTVKAASRTARRPPSRKKFCDLLTALPMEAWLFPTTVIWSPAFLAFSKLSFKVRISSFSPRKRYAYLTLLPGWRIFVSGRSSTLMMALGAKAKLLDPLSGSEIKV